MLKPDKLQELLPEVKRCGELLLLGLTCMVLQVPQPA
jgi:hypothetical protein